MSKRTSSTDCVYTHSVCTNWVCVCIDGPKGWGGEATKHRSGERAANTAVLPQVNTRSSSSTLLLLLLLCAKLHTQTTTSRHIYQQSVGTPEVA